MKKQILLLASVILIISCNPGLPPKYKHVVKITTESRTYPVTVTKQTGGNTIERGATGALVGGVASGLLFGKAKTGAIIGGLLGAATTDAPETESFTEMRTDVTYTIKFSDSTIQNSTNYCRFAVGDSLDASIH